MIAVRLPDDGSGLPADAARGCLFRRIAKFPDHADPQAPVCIRLRVMFYGVASGRVDSNEAVMVCDVFGHRGSPAERFVQRARIVLDDSHASITVGYFLSSTRLVLRSTLAVE